MLLLAGFMALATDEVLQLPALVLFWPRKVIIAAEQVLATKSARPKIKYKNGRTISILPYFDDPKCARVYGLSALYAIRITRPILGREGSADLSNRIVLIYWMVGMVLPRTLPTASISETTQLKPAKKHPVVHLEPSDGFFAILAFPFIHAPFRAACNGRALNSVRISRKRASKAQ